MKKIATLSLLVSLISAQSFATPILLEKNYTNYAWGYQNYGCLIDESGFVYTYNVSSGTPITLTGDRLTTEEVKDVREMVFQARESELKIVRRAADAGTYLWTASYGGRTIKLKQGGDFVGLSVVVEASSLVQLLDRVCK